MPVTQSPSYHGYDVVDYTRVDDEYGTNEDFKRLMQEAHARGIRVIVDLVLNHTSAQHPWFQESLDPASPRRDWYVWSDRSGGEGWHAGPSGYYYGYFWDQMPDLNYSNPQVTEAMQAVTRFWLEDMGVDGFRLDAIKHLDEDGPIHENTPGTHAWLQGFHTFYKGINPQALAVGEVWSRSAVVAQYIGDEVDLAFEFDTANAILQSAVGGRKANVQRAQQKALDSYPDNQFATFLANHDQNRARSRLLNDEQAKLAATLQLAFCGVPFVYYGEEIGMQGIKPDEDIRRPMQWGPEGGFSAGTPWHAYFEDYRQRHVAGQSADPASLLSHYRELLRLRNTHPALRVGSCQIVETKHPAVYAFLRVNDQEIVLVVVNLDRKPVSEYRLSSPSGLSVIGLQPELLMGQGALQAPIVNETGGFNSYQPIETLPAYASVIIGLVPPAPAD
jgi:alpha-amylase